MSLRLEQREVEGIVLLRLEGRLVIGAELSNVQDKLNSLREERKIRLIFDLKGVGFIDSTGLGALVAAHSAFENAGGAMKLLHLSQRHIKLLVLTKLSTVFHIFNDEQSAIDSFFPDRQTRHFDILEFVTSQEDDVQHLGPPKAGDE